MVLIYEVVAQLMNEIVYISINIYNDNIIN